MNKKEMKSTGWNVLCTLYYNTDDNQQMNSLTTNTNTSTNSIIDKTNDTIHEEDHTNALITRRTNQFSCILPKELEHRINQYDYNNSIQRINKVLSHMDSDEQMFTWQTALALSCLCCGGICYLTTLDNHDSFIKVVSDENARFWHKKGLRLHVDTYINTIEKKNDTLIGPDIYIQQIQKQEYVLVIEEC